MRNANPTNEVPGELLPSPKAVQVPAHPGFDMTLETQMTPFEHAKGMLAGKPLRRPNRTRPIEYGEPGKEFDIRETYAVQERSALAAGWADPEMDVYDDYDAHRP